MGQTRMFRDRVVSMEQTLEGGEKHLPILKELCREALPELEYREHVLDHERDLFVMDMEGPGGVRKRIAWTRMMLFDAERLPTMSADPTAALRTRIIEFIRSQAARTEIVVTFRHLEDGWVDTPEPKRESRRRRRGGRGGRGGERGERPGSVGRPRPAAAAGSGGTAAAGAGWTVGAGSGWTSAAGTARTAAAGAGRPAAALRTARRAGRRGRSLRRTRARSRARGVGRSAGAGRRGRRGRRRRQTETAIPEAAARRRRTPVRRRAGRRRRGRKRGRRRDGSGRLGSRRSASMNFDLSDDQKEIRRSVREFAEAEIAPHVTRWEKDEHFPREILARMERWA